MNLLDRELLLPGYYCRCVQKEAVICPLQGTVEFYKTSFPVEYATWRHGEKTIFTSVLYISPFVKVWGLKTKYIKLPTNIVHRSKHKVSPLQKFTMWYILFRRKTAAHCEIQTRHAHRLWERCSKAKLQVLQTVTLQL